MLRYRAVENKDRNISSLPSASSTPSPSPSPSPAPSKSVSKATADHPNNTGSNSNSNSKNVKLKEEEELNRSLTLKKPGILRETLMDMDKIAPVASTFSSLSNFGSETGNKYYYSSFLSFFRYPSI